MDKSREDALLIDLEKSVLNNDVNPPLIPTPLAPLMNPGNNPFDTVAEQTNFDPFEMMHQKACNDRTSKNTNLDVRYDLVSLNDSDEKHSSAKTPNDAERCDLVKLNNSDTKNSTVNLEDSHCNSFLSPIKNVPKSNVSINISAVSPLEHSVNESGNSSVFLGDIPLDSEQNIKDFVASRVQNVINKNLNKSFAGFGQKKDQVQSRAKARSTAISVSTDDGISPGDRNESKTFSDMSSKSYGSMNNGILKSTLSSNSDSVLEEKQEADCDSVMTITPLEKKTSAGPPFHSTPLPLEILREATRLSRSFSVGAADYANVIDNNEDLLSIKPKWVNLDWSSDEDCSDDSLKSLSLNVKAISICTPPRQTPDPEVLKKFKNRLSLLAAANSNTDKEPAVKQRSRSADRTISDSALKSMGPKTYQKSFQPVMPVSKLEDVKLRPKNPEPIVKKRQGPMKALVPVQNMLRGKDTTLTTATKKPVPFASKMPTKSLVSTPPSKKSTSKPAASSTPKRIRKPLAENNAQDSPSPKVGDKSYRKRSNSYEIRSTTPESKITYRSSSVTRVSGGLRPPTPVNKLPGLIQGSPNKAREEFNTTPKKRIAIPTLKARQGKENIMSRF